MATDILIVGPSWVGDMVMADSLVRLIRRNAIGEIHLVAPKRTAILGTRMSGIAQTHVLDVAHGELGLVKRWRLARDFRGKFAQAIVLPNSFKSALVPLFSKVPLRTGWLGEYRYGLINDVRNRNSAKHPKMIEQMAALGISGADCLQDVPIPQLTVDPENVSDLVGKFGLSLAKPITAICPGADFGPAKRWPSQYFRQVAKTVTERGGAVWVLGSDRDRVAGDLITSGFNDTVTNLCGRTTLLDAIDLISKVDQVVCNDSGLMHISCALNKKVVAIFGSSSATFTPPFGVKAEIVQKQLSCSPCFKRDCPLGHTKCLVDLTPQEVVGRL